MKEFKPTDLVWVCSECKSIDIQDACWVDPNTDEIIDTMDFHRWCGRCDEEQGWGELKYFDSVPYSESREYLESRENTFTLILIC